MLLDGFFIVELGVKYVNDVTFSVSYITLSSLTEITFNASYFIFKLKKWCQKELVHLV